MLHSLYLLFVVGLIGTILKEKEHIVFSYLCRRANKYSISYPSMETIAEECNFPKSTVKRIIDKLEELNLIKIVKLKKPIIERYQKIINVYEIQPVEKWKVKPRTITHDNYIDANKFNELIMYQLKIQKAQQSLIDVERTQSIENKYLESHFSQKMEHKDINNKKYIYITKENDITEEKPSETESLDKKQKEKNTNKQKDAKDIAKIHTSKHQESSANADVSANSRREKNIQYREYLPEKSFKLKENTDFERKPVNPKTRYKLYAYRQYYRKYLNWKWNRLNKDDVLFFLINSEPFVENESLTLQQVLKIMKYADSNPKVKNPVGWLIARFMIGRGRFYFLLSKPNKKQEIIMSEHFHQEHKDKQNNELTQKQRCVYINEDLMYFAQKYNIPEKDIMSYLNKSKCDGDVSFIVEMYIADRLWKEHLSREEKQELIQYARQKIRKFPVPPKPEEIKSELTSIIFSEIKSRYLTLSIEDRIKIKTSSKCYNSLG
jgi:DNA-binding Lrp family transcriptional regulator